MIIRARPKPPNNSERWVKRFFWWPQRYPDWSSRNWIWWQWGYQRQCYWDLWGWGHKWHNTSQIREKL